MAGRVAAVGPHELAVIMNRESGPSVALAEAYAGLRDVPRRNLIPVHIPLQQGRGPLAMTPAEFTRLIWNPVRRELRERGLESLVQAWVYSVDIPLRVTTDPPMSVQGLTFVRNRIPPSEAIAKGTYQSPLYAGEGMAGRPGFAPQTFDSFARWLHDDMPLPSMLLGVTAPGGNSEAEILAYLRRGKASDGTFPAGTIYFVTSDDIRSRCRAWQFPPAVRALRHMRVPVRITDTFPEGANDVMGLMMGAPVVNPQRIGSFLPGAVAEHLTSFAGDFSSTHQTKLSRWLAAGATGSAGTVTEPYSIPAKFPSARLFAFYASGCTLIESFAQAVESPLQLITVGDPLAAPWAPQVDYRLHGLPASGRLSAPVEVTAARGAGDRGPVHFGRYEFFINGQPAGTGTRIRLDPASLAPGEHELRFVARRTGLIQSQVYVRELFQVGP